MVDGTCRLRDCPDRVCPEDFICHEGMCQEVACIAVECPVGETCANGECYPEDCQTRTCPGVGEVCIDEECQVASCVDVECPAGQRCAAGQCYPIDCETKQCPGYGEVCIDDECVERSCVGVQCPPGQSCAGGFCYPDGCGSVGCFGEGEVCIDGVCQRRACVNVECEAGFKCSNGWCYPDDCPGFECSDYGEVCYEDQCVQVDCVGVTCPAGERCARGECFPETCGTEICEDYEVCYQDRCIRTNCVGVQCPPGQKCADGECLSRDCAQEGCGHEEVCVDGSCVPDDCAHLPCPAGEVCGADLACHPQDCPGQPCGPYEVCYNGQCIDQLCIDVQCPAGQICSAGYCYDPDCASPCDPDELCEDGWCVPVDCAGGRCCPPMDCTNNNQCMTYECDDAEMFTCLFDGSNPVWDVTGNDCTDNDPCTYDDVCTAGACVGTDIVCDPGEWCVGGLCHCGGTGPDCSGIDTCCGTDCVDLQTNLDHCGACDALCRRDNATPKCEGGVCSIDHCDNLWDDCNGQDPDGCEVSLETLTDCGSCGIPCSRTNATASCAGGNCHIGSCDNLWGDCDGNDPNGCETPLNTMTDCGACNTPCSLANATEECSTGQCRIVSCDNLWGDCDSNHSTGCESRLDTVANCGSCGTLCSRANASEQCPNGNCQILSCNTNYYDINGVDSDGCECGDTSDVAGTCASAAGVGTVSGSNPSITRNGVIVYRTGVRTDEDCYAVSYNRPAPGSGTFRIRLSGSGLEFRVWRNGCTNSVCGGDTTYTSDCSSLGPDCESGNSNNFRVCVRNAGTGSMCRSYTLTFELI